MVKNDEIADQISGYLLQVKAVKLNPREPFTWASGIRSPIYCDNRVTLSYPRIRTYIRQAFVNLINEQFGTLDLIAGVATGAIAHGALVAQEMGLPFVYVRSEKKSHGLTNVIEGHCEAGQSLVVVEDLVSTGSSSLHAVEALRGVECNVKGMVAIFTYGLKKAEDNFKKENCELYTLTDYHYLIRKALEENYIREEDMMTLKKWREDPENWWTSSREGSSQ
jgi:orotate phosphoribosyltransferase